MASAAEQMAANLSWGALGKASDLRQRIFFTIGLLIVYRLGTYIPVPGIDGGALRNFMSEVSATITESRAFGALQAPVKRLCGLDAPIPYNPKLEAGSVPQVADIVREAAALVEEW